MKSNTDGQEVVDLISAIEDRVKQVHPQSLDISFNELLDMYKNSELNIRPEYQRLFQWSEGARSRFIESLLLRMPVPPIYVLEEDDGKYILIDGLQRISSYLHLRGELEAKHIDPPVHKGNNLILTDCDIVEELNGKTFEDIGTTLQIRLKRAFVRVEVIRKGSDPRLKYHMFKRLNTGGQILSHQQMRNCTIRLLDEKFNNFIIELSQEETFCRCIESVTQERTLSAFDQELVLRFFAMKNNLKNFKHDVASFLTKYMEMVSDPDDPLLFNYKTEKEVFLKTFTILDRTLGDLSFTYSNQARDKLTKGFSVYHFESFTIGLQSFLKNISPDDSKLMKKLKNVFMEIKLDPKFINITTGGGKNSPGPLNKRINFVKNKVDDIL